MKCNRCKLVNPANAATCKRCYAPLSNQSKISNESEGGIYHDNDLLVIELRASLPKRCYKCNSIETVDDETQELEYVPYFQKRLKVVAGAAISGAGLLPLTPGRKAIDVVLHTCTMHRSPRKLIFKVGATALVSSNLGFFLAARVLSHDGELFAYLTILWVVLSAFGIVILTWGAYREPIKFKNYRDSYFWASGFGEEYLKSFPNLADAQQENEVSTM